jgi:hypothetical protein
VKKVRAPSAYEVIPEYGVKPDVGASVSEPPEYTISRKELDEPPVYAYVYVYIEEVIFALIPIVPELVCADVMYPAAVPDEQVVAVVQMSAVFQPVP